MKIPFKNIFFHFIYLDKKKKQHKKTENKDALTACVCNVISLLDTYNKAYFGHKKIITLLL